MRKFFALALAVAMVMSLAAVSFAAYNTVADVYLQGPFRYDGDANAMTAPGAATLDSNGNVKHGEHLRYGEGAYYLIRIADAVTGTPVAAVTDRQISSYKEVEKLKVKAEFEMGGDLVESVSIVKKAVDSITDTTGTVTVDAPYLYFVEVKVAAKQTTSDADIVGTLEFNRKADKDVKINGSSDDGIGKIKDDEFDINFNVFYKDNWNNKVGTTYSDLYVGKSSDEVELKYDTNYALKFDSDDEVELQFGQGELNEGTFTVDVSGQGKLFVRYNTTPDEAIVAANPGAKMFFVNFNNAKFNRVGEFVYEMDGIAAAYKVVDGQLVEIKGLELDADTATFNTRVLESYVFADAELVNPVAAVEAPAVEAPAATNPSTGANA